MGNNIEEIESDVEESSSRRKFLKTTGKFAIYTPPALMVMTSANAKRMAKSGGYSGGGKTPKRKKAKRKKGKRKTAKRKS